LVEFAGANSRLTTLLDTTVKLVSECEGMLAGSGGVAHAARFGAAKVAIALVCSLTAFTGLARANPPTSGTSDDEAQQDARRQIPYDKLSADACRKVDAVLSSVTLYRRLPTQIIRCDPDLFHFMTTRPDVTVNIWQVLDLSNIRLSRTGESTFRADDSAGTKSDVQFLYATRDTLLIYAVGTYQGPLFVAPIRGGALLLLKTGYIREQNGQSYVTTRLDAFFRVENLGADLLTRTLRPLVNDNADKNFHEAALFLRNLSRAAEVDPEYMDRLSRKLTNVSDADRQRFAELALQAAERAVRVNIRKASHVADSSAETPAEHEMDSRATRPESMPQR
jgi:hypothetical protein